MPQALKLLGWLTSLSASGRKTVPVAEIERIVQGALHEPDSTAANGQASALEQVEALARYLRDARAGLMHPPQDEPAMEMIGKAVLSKDG